MRGLPYLKLQRGYSPAQEPYAVPYLGRQWACGSGPTDRSIGSDVKEAEQAERPCMHAPPLTCLLPVSPGGEVTAEMEDGVLSPPQK